MTQKWDYDVDACPSGEVVVLTHWGAEEFAVCCRDESGVYGWIFFDDTLCDAHIAAWRLIEDSERQAYLAAAYGEEKE